MRGSNAFTKVGKSILDAVKVCMSTGEDDALPTTVDDIPDFSLLVESQQEDAVNLKKVENGLKNARRGGISRNRSSNIQVRPRQPKAIRTVREEKEER